MKWLSINQVAAHFEVSRAIITAWIESGELQAEDHASHRGGYRRLRVHVDALRGFSERRAVGRGGRVKRRTAPRREVRSFNKYSPALG